MSGAPTGWDATYSGAIPPWVTGRPQPAILGLAEAGRLSGTVLDIGCGTGEHTMLAAELGCDALGIDVSSVAIEMARRSAAHRRIEARFQVMNAFEMVDLDRAFDVAIDSGHFHCVAPDRRRHYSEVVGKVLRAGGFLFLTDICDDEPGGWGPPRISRRDIEGTFRQGWEIEGVDRCWRERRDADVPLAAAWLASIRRTD